MPGTGVLILGAGVLTPRALALTPGVQVLTPGMEVLTSGAWSPGEVFWNIALKEDCVEIEMVKERVLVIWGFRGVSACCGGTD